MFRVTDEPAKIFDDSTFLPQVCVIIPSLSTFWAVWVIKRIDKEKSKEKKWETNGEKSSGNK